MATLKVLSSGSIGNSYIISTENEDLILELGISWSEINKGLNYQIQNIVGVLVTHSHT